MSTYRQKLVASKLVEKGGNLGQGLVLVLYSDSDAELVAVSTGEG